MYQTFCDQRQSEKHQPIAALSTYVRMQEPALQLV